MLPSEEGDNYSGSKEFSPEALQPIGEDSGSKEFIQEALQPIGNKTT